MLLCHRAYSQLSTLQGWIYGGRECVEIVVEQGEICKENLMPPSTLGVPLGAKSTKFRGRETDQPGLCLSSRPSLFAQLIW